MSIWPVRFFFGSARTASEDDCGLELRRYVLCSARAAELPGEGFRATSEFGGIAERVAALYEARSEIVHSDSGKEFPFQDGAAFVTGFDLARRSLFNLLRVGIPENWEAASLTRE